MKIQREHDIENFDDLRAKKTELIKKARKKEKKLRKRINKLQSKTSVPMVYEELLSEFELQNGLMQMLPYILKYGGHITQLRIFDKVRNTPWKRFAIMLLGSFSAGLYTYYHLTKKEEQKQKTKTQYTSEKPEEKKSAQKKEKTNENSNSNLFI